MRNIPIKNNTCSRITISLIDICPMADLIKLDNNKLVILRVSGHKPSQEEPLDKVKQKIKEVSIIQLLEYYLIQANNLEITDDQRKGLSDLPKKYIYPMTIKNAEYEISVLDVVDILTNPNFNTDELKSALKKSKAQALEMSLFSVDAIDEIRQIIGLDNFTIIMNSMKTKK